MSSALLSTEPTTGGLLADGGWSTRLRLLGLAFLLLMISNPWEFLIKGIVPGAASLTDPSTSRAIYANAHLQMALKGGILLALGGLAAWRWRAALRMPPRFPLLCAFYLYVACSVRWSETPGNSITDVIYLTTALLAGVVLVVWCDELSVARVIGYTGLLIAGFSLLTILALPLYGVHGAEEASQGGHAGAWRGVYTHKNALGQIMAVFFIIYAVKGRELLGARWIQYLAMALTLLLVLKSRSASAFVLVGLCGAAYGVFFLMQGLARVVCLMLAPPLLVMGLALKDVALQALGRGSDFSGRTEIWSAAYRMFIQQPLFGYGYGSASVGGLTPYIIARFHAQNTHNGYIDLALSAGLVGSLLLYGAVAWAIARAATARGPHVSLLTQVCVIFLIGWGAAALSEVSLRPNLPMGALGFAILVVMSTLTRRRGESVEYRRPADGDGAF
ncbi:O-antigen ligase family protein [Caulobacter sp.]|uniref:O-antigen ligase family protein n=1 Tax=Caulobacter sp. TaxID=78 RepID=UPI003BAC5350